MRFWKYEGLGNDFVIVHEDGPGSVITKERAVAICDRHRGVGADGVLVVSAHREQPSMRVINSDGSLPEMCGNGLRCAALHVARFARMTEGTLMFQTDSGPHACRVVDAGNPGIIEVMMKPAALSPSQVPVIAINPVVDQRFDIDGTGVHITAVSMGNPHAVIFDAVGDARTTLGPKIQKHTSFPKSVNVGFATQIGSDTLDLAVLERGAGWTEACGTGACAAAVAAVETKRMARNKPITVRLPGGALTVEVGAAGEPIKMTGPARFVFEGELAI